MKLSDLFKTEIAADERKFEVLRSDFSNSGQHITLIDPASDKAATAAFMFDAAISRRSKKYEDANKALFAECQEAGDFSEYNIGFELSCRDIRDAFCHEIVEGWDFDDELTRDSLQAALDAFRAPVLISLQRQVITAYRNMAEAHAKK